MLVISIALVGLLSFGIARALLLDWVAGPSDSWTFELSVGLTETEVEQRLGPPRQRIQQQVAGAPAQVWGYQQADRALEIHFQQGRVTRWTESGGFAVREGNYQLPRRPHPCCPKKEDGE